jgi:hypothetical protein
LGGAVGTATETLGGAVGTATETLGGAVGTVGETVGGAVGTVGETVGGAIGAVGETVGGAVGTVDDTVGGAIDATGGLQGIVDGATDAGIPSLPSLPPVTSDPILGPVDAATSVSAADGTRTGVSALQRDPLNMILATDVHPASAGATPPDVAGGAEPGPVPPDGLPFPLDAAAAALSSLTEAGGTSVVWAFLALLVLLPARDDRWLRLVRAVQPTAPLVASTGRPG